MAHPPETFPPQGITDDVFDFLKEIHDGLAHDPVTREAFVALFMDSGKSGITDVERVTARAVHHLWGHPHLVAQFYDLVDPVHRGLEFLKRAEKALGPAKYDLFVTKLYNVEEERSLDAHEVYQGFKELLGEKHGDLLQGLAEFLPRKYVPPPPPRASAKAEREEHRRRPERKQLSYAGADAPESSRPNRAKKPRVVDVHVGPTPQPVRFADTSAAGSSRARRPRMYEYEHDASLPERKPAVCAVSVADGSKSSRPSRAKRPRTYEDEYDGSLTERKPASCAAVSVLDDSKSSRPSRAKKPRADDSMSRHASISGAARGSVRVAAAPALALEEVKRFREAWEFETSYSLLDATLKRAEKVMRERLNIGVRASLDELFPSSESRGHLAKMYHERWNHMRQLLEHGGDQTAFALQAVVNSLRIKDAEAVNEARRRQDPARAAQRLQELARDRVSLERERVRETNEANEQRRQPRTTANSWTT